MKKEAVVIVVVLVVVVVVAVVVVVVVSFAPPTFRPPLSSFQLCWRSPGDLLECRPLNEEGCTGRQLIKIHMATKLRGASASVYVLLNIAWSPLERILESGSMAIRLSPVAEGHPEPEAKSLQLQGA